MHPILRNPHRRELPKRLSPNEEAFRSLPPTSDRQIGLRARAPARALTLAETSLTMCFMTLEIGPKKRRPGLGGAEKEAV